MTRKLLVLILMSFAVLTLGCSSAQAACPGGNCSRGWGVWSPWVGGYYYRTQCAGGKCRTAAKPADPAPEEPVPEPIPADDPAAGQKIDLPDESEIADTVPQLVEFKPFCVRVAELVNKQRAAIGLPALTLDGALCSGCDRHSSWMANGGGFQHAYYAGARECIAYGVRTPEAVVSMWLNSSGHRAIILGGGKTLGVGCSGSYWTLRVR